MTNDRNTRSLTEGPPLRILVAFTFPLLLGLAFQQFYGMIDTVLVGKFLGVDALAGVGSTSSINFLVIGSCSGICSGFAIPVAQKFGQKDLDGLRRIVGNIVWLSLGFAAGITLLVCVLCRQILVWMHTPPETFGYAYTYIFIIFLGIPSMIFYNVLSGIIRSLGNSRAPLHFLVFSSLLNIALDLILILWAGWGVAGAAWATVISQIVSGLLCLVYICRCYPLLHLSRDDLKPRRAEARKLLAMGLPMGLQYTITAVGCTTLQAAVNQLGPVAMAAYTAGNRVQTFLATPFDAIGIAAATWTGQNVGAGKLDRIHRGTLINFVLGCIYSVLALGLVALWGPQTLLLFLDPSAAQTAQILVYGQQFLMVNVANYVFLLAVNLFRFAIQGMGFSGLAIFAGVLELIGRTVLSLWLVPIAGYTAVCFGHPAAWFRADLFLVPMYFIGVKLLRRRFAQPLLDD